MLPRPEHRGDERADSSSDVDGFAVERAGPASFSCAGCCAEVLADGITYQGYCVSSPERHTDERAESYADGDGSAVERAGPASFSCASVLADGITYGVSSPERDANKHADSSSGTVGVTYCVSSPERHADESADSSTDGDGSAVERAGPASFSCASLLADGITYGVSSPTAAPTVMASPTMSPRPSAMPTARRQQPRWRRLLRRARRSRVLQLCLSSRRRHRHGVSSPERNADEHADGSTDRDGITYCVSAPERHADERADSTTDGDGSAVERASPASFSCTSLLADGVTHGVSSPERDADEHADSSTDTVGVTYCASSPERHADESADSSTDGAGSAGPASFSYASLLANGIACGVSSPTASPTVSPHPSAMPTSTPTAAPTVKASPTASPRPSTTPTSAPTV